MCCLEIKDRAFRLFLRRRKLFCMFAISVGFFVINIYLIAYYIDSHTNDSNTIRDIASGEVFFDRSFQQLISKQETQKHQLCNRSESPFSISAYERMKTQECRSKLTKFLCTMYGRHGWPVTKIDNTCTRMFVESRVQMYKGCFMDKPSSRLLRDFKYEFKTKNSPMLCVQACLRAGFVFAGVEYGFQCFCGNNTPEDIELVRIADEECQSYICPNFATQFCGGFEALALYTTGVIDKKKRIPVYQLPPYLLSSLTEEEADGSRKAFLQNSAFFRPRILFLLQINGRNSRQIRRLIKLIFRPHHLYYVHVDARQQYMQQEMLDVEKILRRAGFRNFYVARGASRYVTIWGGTSLLDMFLDVVSKTLSNFSHDELKEQEEWSSWNYILNLSETDMLLLSMDELEYNLMSNMGMSFLSTHGYNTGNFLRKQGFNFYFMECEQRMWIIGNRSNFPANLRLDGGSDWVIIHRDLAVFAVDTNNNLANQLKQLFTTILLPLESFFHTLALNSEFCQRVLYRNLRLTNWRRRQGCRCAWLKKVVDWCGCSPLVIRFAENRFDVQKCQSRLYFFARKFDTLIDVEAIAAAERQVFRFHSRSFQIARESFPSFNSTWISVFQSNLDFAPELISARKLTLYNNWFDSVIFNLPTYLNLQLPANCKTGLLIEIFAFKSEATAQLQIGLISNLTCSVVSNYTTADGSTDDKHSRFASHISRLEILTERRRKSNIFQGNFILANELKRRWKFELDSIEFGTHLDLKEDVFREPTGLIEMDGALTILWYWRAHELHPKEVLNANFQSLNISKLPTNHTSPPVILEIRAPTIQQGSVTIKLIFSKLVLAYDSINFAQHLKIDLSGSFEKKHNTVSGIWTAKILSEHGEYLGEMEFPVYPSTNLGDDLFARLTNRFYRIIDICSTDPDQYSPPREIRKVEQQIRPKSCRDTFWSTRFPDPKSEIRHGFDESLAILV